MGRHDRRYEQRIDHSHVLRAAEDQGLGIDDAGAAAERCYTSVMFNDQPVVIHAVYRRGAGGVLADVRKAVGIEIGVARAAGPERDTEPRPV